MIYVAINKKLITDIANQRKLPQVIISADATNYFNRVAHPYSGIVCQHFGLLLSYVSIFFEMIQQIIMYLITSYGVSNNFYSGNEGQ